MQVMEDRSYDDNRATDYARGWARFAASDQSGGLGLGCGPSMYTVMTVLLLALVIFFYLHLT
jgi:hypothetical protein